MVFEGLDVHLEFGIVRKGEGRLPWLIEKRWLDSLRGLITPD